MAFGSVKGTLTGSGTSVAATNSVATGSAIAVVVGDLIWVTFGQQTNLVSAGITPTDNLGNTYIVTTGFDAGTVTVRGAWAVVTQSTVGNLSSVTCPSGTTSTNDWAASAVVIEGPVLPGDPLASTTPTPIEDTTSTFTGPSTGTLDNTPARTKIIIGYEAHSTNTSWTPEAGTKAGESLSANVSVSISVQTATGTTGVVPTWTAGANPTDDALGSVAFNYDYTAHVLDFAGAGSLTADAIRQIHPTSTMAGAGALTVDAEFPARAVISFAAVEYTRPPIQISATFAGIGAMTATPSAYAVVSYAAVQFTITTTAHSGSAQFDGAGSLTANAIVGKHGSVLFDGAGGFTANAVVAKAGSALFAGAGALTSDAVVTKQGAALFAGAGSFTAAVTARLAASATFAGAGGFTVAAIRVIPASATFAGVGSLSATLAAPIAAQATFAGAGGLTATVTARLSASAAFAGAGLLAANATRQIPASATFAGAGGLTADVTQAGIHQGSATFGGAGSLTVNVSQRFAASALFDGAGSLTAAAIRAIPAAATFAGSGGLTVTETQRYAASALFAGAGSLSASTTQWMQAAANFAGAGALAANTLQTHQLSAIFSGSGSLATDAVVLPPAAIEATFTGAGNLTATASHVVAASALFDGTGSLTASTLRSTFATANFGGEGALTAATAQRLPASALFGGAGNLIVDATVAGTPVLPVNIIKPAVTGTATVGQLLSCSTGTWAGPPHTFTYQWYRAVTSGGVPVTIGDDYVGIPIAGATSSTYTLVEADADEFIFCDVVATNIVGSGPPESSNLTAAVFTSSISATFAGAGAINAHASANTNISATFGGAGALVATATGPIGASAIFAGNGALVADGVATDPVLRAVISYASVRYRGSEIVQAQAAFAGAGSLQVNTGVVDANKCVISHAAVRYLVTRQNIEALFAGAGSLQANAQRAVLAQAAFAGVGSLSAEFEGAYTIISYAAVRFVPTPREASLRVFSPANESTGTRRNISTGIRSNIGGGTRRNTQRRIS